MEGAALHPPLEDSQNQIDECDAGSPVKKKRLDDHDGKMDKSKPGIRFKEEMSGEVIVDSQPHHFQFTLTIETQDVERMIKEDNEHSAQIYGTVTCTALSESPLKVSNGSFQLFSRSREKVETREMIYKMVITSKEGKTYYLKGIKEVHKDSAFEIGLKDTTILNITLHEGNTDTGQHVGIGKLFVTLNDFVKLVHSLEVINTSSPLEKIKWKAKFGRFFIGILWETYGLLTTASSPFDPEAPAREKRQLELQGATPEEFLFQTEDDIQLKLTRYKGGTKGPLVLAHGMGVSSKIYSLDTIKKNFLEFLLEHKYDVWLLEWRASTELDAHELQHTLDAVAKHDMPTAVNKVLRETGAQDVQILVHCVGSITFFMSMLSGQLEGKIRCVVSSQVAFCTVPSATNWLKAHTRVPSILHRLGIQGLTAYTDAKASFVSRALNTFIETYADATTQFDEHCDNHVCHRITFMYGLPWEHENLNVATHATLHEIFGYGTATFFKHLSACMRKEFLVDENGESATYLPNFDSKYRLQSDAYMKHMKRLDVPILFYCGEKNKVFQPAATLLAYERCHEVNPEQDYERLLFSGYGHLDHMIGKNVEDDIFMKLLPFLEKYAYSTSSGKNLMHMDTQVSGTPV